MKQLKKSNTSSKKVNLTAKQKRMIPVIMEKLESISAEFNELKKQLGMDYDEPQLIELPGLQSRMTRFRSQTRAGIQYITKMFR